jgi:hypothetical protein
VSKQQSKDAHVLLMEWCERCPETRSRSVVIATVFECQCGRPVRLRYAASVHEYCYDATTHYNFRQTDSGHCDSPGVACEKLLRTAFRDGELVTELRSNG